jgi:CysZ protein
VTDALDEAASEPRARRPGVLRRLAAGAWNVPAGLFYVVRNPSLWPLAVLPAVLCALFVVGGLFGGMFLFPRIQSALAMDHARVAPWLDLLLTLTLGVGVLATGAALGFALAFLLAAPILDRLSRRAEMRLRGQVEDRGHGLRWEIAQSLRGALYFLAVLPIVFVLGLVPLAGPFLSALWGAVALSLQFTEAPLSRRGLGFVERRGWHRRWLPESLGFGLAALLVFLVPLANLLLGPALAVGGTLLVLDLEPEAVAPAPPPPEPAPSPVEAAST